MASPVKENISNFVKLLQCLLMVVHPIVHLCLFGTKPLPEPMLAYCPGNNFQWNSYRNCIIFIQEWAFEIVVCQNGGHFVQGEMSWNLL